MKQGKVIIYQLLPDFNIKIMTEIPVEIKLAFPKNLSVSVDGQLILTSDQNNNPFIINQSDFNSDLEAELQPLWINGHCHNSKIITIVSPELNSIMVSLDDEGGVKVWSLGEREKFLLIDTVFKGKVIDVDIHPCGFLLAVNFGLEIKVYAIVSM
jgi:WD40 repeat protein